MVSIIKLTVYIYIYIYMYTFDGLILGLCVSKYGFVLCDFKICDIGMKLSFDQEIREKKMVISELFLVLIKDM